MYEIFLFEETDRFANLLDTRRNLLQFYKSYLRNSLLHRHAKT